MAKAFNPYQNAAPPAMAQMGQGLSQAGAQIGQSIASGYRQAGVSIGEGLTAAIGEFANYQKMKSEVAASQKSYDQVRDYLDPAVRQHIDNQIKEINEDPGLSLQDKAEFWRQTKSNFGAFVSEGFKKQEAEQQNRLMLERQQQILENQEKLKRLEIQARAEEFGGPATPTGPTTSGGTGMSGAPFYDSGMAPASAPAPAQPANPYGSFLKKHFPGIPR